MADKTCRNCKKPFPVEYFQTKAGRTKYAHCPKCRRDADKKRKKAARQADYGSIRLHLIAALGAKCQHCGYNHYTPTLEFYHITSGVAIPTLINRFCYLPDKGNWTALTTELSKCALLCPSCTKALRMGLLDDRILTPFRGIVQPPDL